MILINADKPRKKLEIEKLTSYLKKNFRKNKRKKYLPLLKVMKKKFKKRLLP
jgi:hypothetical protein